MRTVNELFRLDERVAIVTGGAGHIGLAFGEALSEQGARVVVVDRQRLACEERAHVLETKSGVKALALPEDLSDSAAPGRVVAATLAAFGRIDVIVNNAAFTGASGLPGYAVPFPEQSLEAWEASRVRSSSSRPRTRNSPPDGGASSTSDRSTASSART